MTFADHITLQGRVQGAGVRPTIARLARQWSLHGLVRNTPRGVEILVAGRANDRAAFLDVLRHTFPTAAIEVDERPGTESLPSEFEIAESTTGTPPAVLLPPDVAICPDCRRELDSPGPRADYAFTSCTRCGPRYGVIRGLPWDRLRTGYGSFPPCERCQHELRDPTDRRFHAQISCCPRCGPRWWVVDRQGTHLPVGEPAWQAVVRTLRDGLVIAVRGPGGYQLLCDATRDIAVRRLRTAKARPSKPFALLVRDLPEAERLGQFCEGARVEFTSGANPIVVVPGRANAGLAPSVTCGLSEIGLMAPSTGWHWLLVRYWTTPLVVTSGNREGQSLVTSVDRASTDLAGVADLFVHTDAPLETPQDDSVVRLIGGRPATLRLARGFAPWPLPLELPPSPPGALATPAVTSTVRGSTHWLALGGHQKSAIALTNGQQALLGGQIGDLDTLTARDRFDLEVERMTRLYQLDQPAVLHDGHPAYYSTARARRGDRPAVAVQHHHAHVVAGLLEHGCLDGRVLGLAFDGTGWGPDGTIWGGEALLSTAVAAERVAHLRPFLLPGGELAVRQPWRVAAALLWQIANPDEWAQLCRRLLPAGVQSLAPLLRYASGLIETPRGLSQSLPGGVLCSSFGRLFDAVASLAGICHQAGYEGEPARRLESEAGMAEAGGYDLPLDQSSPRQWDWRPLVRQLVADRLAGVGPQAIAARFHQAVARACVGLAGEYPSLAVVLSGGCFQNRLLCELISAGLPTRVLGPGRIPVHDGGLAAGQLAIGLARQARGMLDCSLPDDVRRTP